MIFVTRIPLASITHWCRSTKPLFIKRKRASEGRDLLYATLIRALKIPGCPICHLVAEVEEQSIKSLLYGYVNDTHVHSRILEHGGLCPYHLWRIAEIAQRDLPQ